jgi:hypothetical protein
MKMASSQKRKRAKSAPLFSEAVDAVAKEGEKIFKDVFPKVYEKGQVKVGDNIVINVVTGEYLIDDDREDVSKRYRDLFKDPSHPAWSITVSLEDINNVRTRMG